MASERKIIIDDLVSGLYQYHIEGKNHRIARVLRIFILRNDFQDFLLYVKENFIKKESVETRNGKLGYRYMPDIINSDEYISGYINKITKSNYFKSQNSEFQNDFLTIAKYLIIESFLWTYANEKNGNGIFKNTVLTGEDFFKYTSISHELYQKEYFWDAFGEAFFGIPKKQDWTDKNPTQITMCCSPYIEGKSKGEPDPEKICQLLIYENAEKNEVVDYINQHWGSIKSALEANRPPRAEKRLSADSNLIRDIEVYNKYQQFKKEGRTNPDVRTDSWFRNSNESRLCLEPNTIRKIVSLLKSDLSKINCE